MIIKFYIVSIREFAEIIKNKEAIIVDARTVDAYNGWSLQSELRGGHIKGAKSLPFKWTKYIDWIEIVRSKGILPEKQIIIYSYSDLESHTIAQFFIRAGYDDIGIYYNFVDEWTQNPELPMENLERYNQLVYPDWVQSLIS